MNVNNKSTRPTPRKREGSSATSHGVTRRQFIIGAGVTAGVLAVGGGTYFALNGRKTDFGSEKLSVATDQVFKIDDMELVDDVSEFLKLEREIKLAHNTLVFQQSNEVLSMLQSTGEGSPVCTASTLSLTDASQNTVLKAATTEKPRFDVLDFKANEKGCVWIESNVLTGQNFVKTSASLSDVSSTAKTVMATDSTQKMPHVAISGNSLWVQTAPQSSSSGEKERLFTCSIGEDESHLEQVIETRTFATAPSWTTQGIVVTPRNSYSSSRYDIRLLSSDAAEVLDNLTLPQSMLPQDATYGRTGFSFSFQGSYSYGDGISNVGTYVQNEAGTSLVNDDDQSKDARNLELSTKNWLNFNREPTCACAWIGNYACVKSTSSVAVIDIENKRYALIKADDGADDYGVWLVSTGEVEHLVTMQNINYTPLTGNLVKEGRLKIWTA